MRDEKKGIDKLLIRSDSSIVDEIHPQTFRQVFQAAERRLARLMG